MSAPLPFRPAAVGDWRAQLHPSGTEYRGDERNILIALRTAPPLAGVTRFNEFALKVEFTRSPPWREVKSPEVWTETDDTQLKEWLQCEHLKVRSTNAVADCVAVAAMDYPFHPVRKYLTELLWDGQERLSTWVQVYLGARADQRYMAAIGPCFLISAVARIMQPGCQADHVLVLEAAQGAGKTSAARALSIHPEWFAGDLPDIHSKDSKLQLVGRWIVEIAELKAIRSSEIEAQKSFITQCHDTFRPPYGRRTAQFPRQSVFIATTNESEYLRDRTGNRRYWPVKCGRIDVPALTRDRDQLWAEAVHEFHLGTRWHLSAELSKLAEQQQAERVHVSELEADVSQYLAGLKEDKTEVSVREVLCYGLKLDPDKPQYAETARKLGPAVAEALEHCGWVKRGREGKLRRTIYDRRQP